MPKLGPALVLTDEELEELAEIDDEDILRVNAKWRKWVDRWAANLLLASQPESTKTDANSTER